MAFCSEFIIHRKINLNLQCNFLSFLINIKTNSSLSPVLFFPQIIGVYI